MESCTTIGYRKVIIALNAAIMTGGNEMTLMNGKCDAEVWNDQGWKLTCPADAKYTCTMFDRTFCEEHGIAHKKATKHILYPMNFSVPKPVKAIRKGLDKFGDEE